MTTPSEVVELGDCSDADAVGNAVELGADVLECPDWVTTGGKAVPETVVLNEDAFRVARGLQVNEIPDRDVSEAAAKAEQTMRSNKRVGPSIRRPRGMPRHSRYSDLTVKPKRRANRQKGHPYLKKGR